MHHIPTNFLLIELNEERRKFTHADDNLLREMVDELVRRGEYPDRSLAGYSPFEMVESYGAYWHEYAEPLNCPHCQTDLRDLKHGPPYKREIGQYDQGLDRTIGFWCPDCKKQISHG